MSEDRQAVTMSAAPSTTAGSVDDSLSTTIPVIPSRRIHSIDTLRGFDMFFLTQEEPALIMAVWVALRLPFHDALAKQLDHTPWIGFTFWDFIAPLFLFVVGLALPLALSRRIARGESRSTLLNHVFRRTLVLIALGLVFNGILRLHFSDFRYTGVLQRIALSYFFAALITLFASMRYLDGDPSYLLLAHDGLYSRPGIRGWRLDARGQSRRLYRSAFPPR